MCERVSFTDARWSDGAAPRPTAVGSYLKRRQSRTRARDAPKAVVTLSSKVPYSKAPCLGGKVIHNSYRKRITLHQLIDNAEDLYVEEGVP